MYLNGSYPLLDHLHPNCFQNTTKHLQHHFLISHVWQAVQLQPTAIMLRTVQLVGDMVQFVQDIVLVSGHSKSQRWQDAHLCNICTPCLRSCYSYSYRKCLDPVQTGIIKRYGSCWLFSRSVCGVRYCRGGMSAFLLLLRHQHCVLAPAYFSFGVSPYVLTKLQP